MALKVTATKEQIAKEIALALRDAMDDEQFSDIRFYRYISDTSYEPKDDEFELLWTINRPANMEEIDKIANDMADTITGYEFPDYSVQGYEAVTGAINATGEHGIAYDITESITGYDYLEWEIEYVPQYKCEDKNEDDGEPTLSPVTSEELFQKLLDLGNDDELIVYGVEKDYGEGMTPPLAMGVRKTQVFDGGDVFLCNVVGSFCDIQCFIVEDETPENAYNNVVHYFGATANYMCGQHFSHLAIENTCKSQD